MHERKLALLLAVAVIGSGAVRADVFKYVDESGKIYFTDAPLKGSKYKLEWKRESKKLVDENRKRYASTTKPKLPSPSRARSEAPSKSLEMRRTRYEGLIAANARRYGLPPDLLHAVIRTESAYDHTAVSRAGAQGLMQLMPGTAARYGVRDSFDPIQNVKGGAAYLRDLLDMFDQDLRLALAGYNAGENAVIKYGYQIPPYSETQGYVRKVLGHLRAERSTGVVMSVR